MNIFPFLPPPAKKKRVFSTLSRQSHALLRYGLFAVLCQLSLILLHTRIYAERVDGALLSLRFTPFLEHALMSLVILFVGVYLIERIHLEGKK